jgi:hypothetical protein
MTADENRREGDTHMKARPILLAAAGILAMTSLAAPVLAQPYDRDGWHGHHDHWRGHEWREHHERYYAPRAYYAPPPPVVYAPPQAYYAPPPPVVYGRPGVTFGITIP